MSLQCSVSEETIGVKLSLKPILTRDAMLDIYI